MRTKVTIIMMGAMLALLLGASIGFADLPVVPGFSVEVYADLQVPSHLCFGPDGVMYVGNRSNFGGAASVYRIASEGGPDSISLYGPPLWKAGAVGYDKDGLISGTRGALLVGGGMYSESHLTAIFPDLTTRRLWEGLPNLSGDIAFDSSGRMLLVDPESRNVYQSRGGERTVLLTCDLDSYCMALDRDDNIFLSMGHYAQAKVVAYRPDGTRIGNPILESQITTRSSFPVAFGKGGVWGYGLYVIANYVLMRFDSPLESPDTFSIIGTGFNAVVHADMEIGPDGALYVSDQAWNRILRIAPLNVTPVALCQNVTLEAGPGCVADASIDNGSYDPDEDEITITQDPPGPYPLGTTNVTLTVTDSHGSSDTCTATVTVVDTTLPVIAAAIVSPQVVEVGQTVNFDAAIGDECDPTVLWNFGDGVVSSSVVATHAYSVAGIYTVTFTVTDTSGNLTEEEFFVVVYDPAAGFVTGGGWIWSPQGPYLYMDVEGKANFGFVSKYQKGANVPTGQTEFVFQAGDLNFHSSSYEWLVVTGSNYARFKGTGTINGSGVYKFMLWAGDDDPDTFRIKIWTEDELGVEDIVYDNGMDQPIGGGSIVIHTK